VRCVCCVCCENMLTYDIKSVLATPKTKTRALLPVGASFIASPPEPGWAWPWQSVALLINRTVNGIDSTKPSRFAELVYDFDRVLRMVMWLGGLIAAFIMIVLDTAFDITINDVDWPMIAVLITLLVVQLIFVIASLVGRFWILPQQLRIQELEQRITLHLSQLLFNFQSFGLERCSGWTAAVSVILAHIIFTASWSVLMYAALTRVSVSDTHETGHVFVWCLFIFQQLVTATARAVSLGEVRAFSANLASGPTCMEYLRLHLICIYILLVFVVAFPVGVFGLIYAML